MHTYMHTYIRTYTNYNISHYVMLRHATLHYITLHCIALHYIRTCMHTYIHLCSMCMRVCVCECLHLPVCVRVCSYACTRLCECVYVHLCMCMCIYLHVHVHIRVYNNNDLLHTYLYTATCVPTCAYCASDRRSRYIATYSGGYHVCRHLKCPKIKGRDD